MGASQLRKLSEHPNFQVPGALAEISIEAVVRFTLDYAASLVSPPQQDGEDEERPCTQVADELRNSAGAVLAALAKPDAAWHKSIRP